MTALIHSVQSTQFNGPLIAAAASLWVRPGDTVVDATYGRGKFWTHFRPDNLIAHDKFVGDGVDFRQLPEADGSVDVLVFDPPYIAQGGRATSTVQGMLHAYGLMDCPRTTEESLELIAAGIREGTRVLAPGGRLLVKCMDYVNGGRLVLARHHVVTTAMACGLEQVDEFIHHKANPGPQPRVNLDGSPRNQIHSRRTHTFLCVFQKAPVWRKAPAPPQRHTHTPPAGIPSMLEVGRPGTESAERASDLHV